MIAARCILFLVGSVVLAAAEPPTPAPSVGARESQHNPDVGVPFPDQTPAQFDKKETAAINLANEWKAAPTLPTPGQNGKVIYLYGATLPSVICSPLFPTDIELEPGEVVTPNGLHIGDTVRWAVAPATSGSGAAAITHLVIKPQAPGLVTSILCATDRRTYHIKLISSEHDWMPSVAFSYPENAQARWAAYHEAQQKYKDATSLVVASNDGVTVAASIDKLDFSYRIAGDAPWTPIRVYNDGVKTILQMPHAMAQTEAPALLVLGLDNKEQLVNYRVQGDRYIVDQVFARAALISGVGRKQQRVTITHQPPKRRK